jgi:DUF1680 family protein
MALTARITDPFWTQWQKVVSRQSIPHQWRMCEETGRFENFRRAARGESEGYEGYVYNDSDVYKLLEACAHAIHLDHAFSLRAEVDEIAQTIAEAQCEDGYIHTYHQLGRMNERYQGVVGRHELYCMGHLIEAACAFIERGLESPIIAAAEKAAWHVVNTFGSDGIDKTSGHQEIELALCRLGRLRGWPELIQKAQWFIDRRGRAPHAFEKEFENTDFPGLVNNYRSLIFDKEGRYSGVYLQDHMPLEQMEAPAGHAVRMLYYFKGALMAFPPDTPKTEAISNVWRRMTERQMYVTGGIGSSGDNEGFTQDFDLPNENAYAETCAAIALFNLGSMLRLSDFWDACERALYNAALSGIGLSGEDFFYDNPLAAGADKRRQPWFGCACCPPNIARRLLSLDQALVWEDEDGRILLPLWVGLQAASGSLTLAAEASTGPVARFTVRGQGAGVVCIRCPEWAQNAIGSVNGQPIPAPAQDWFEVTVPEGDWRIEITAEAPPRIIPADPRVASQKGRAALAQGPFIYCLEECDLGRSVEEFELDADQPLEWSGASEGLQGRSPGSILARSTLGGAVRFTPYFTWANRVPGSMAVWVNRAPGPA